ncbi:MAG: hypothetical protein ACLPX9_16255 [Rhodomicrobium sp.]
MDFEAEIRRRVTLVEEDAAGEKTVSRHILRKVTENEKLLIELRNEVALLRTDLPGIIANVVGALLREERERK